MSLRRLISVLSVSLVASGGLVAAQPKKGAPAPAPAPAKGSAMAPAKGSGAGSAAAPAGSGAGSASGSAAGSGDVVQMTEDAPPSDMNGTDENPDAPRGTENKVAVVAPVAKKPAAYPIEEAKRPITLPQNMSEVAIGPHAQISPYQGADALRARYGITSKVQLGLTYVLGGIYDDKATNAMSLGFHAGKAVGLDATVMLQDWLGVRVGLPIYVDPYAMSLLLGAPMKWSFGDKFAFGGFDDLLAIKLVKFAPSFYQEAANSLAAYNLTTNTPAADARLHLSVYGVFQQSAKLAIIGRFGFDTNLGSSGGGGAGTGGTDTTKTFIRAGVSFSPRHYLDVGGSLGFDDLAHGGSFGPAGYLALRI